MIISIVANGIALPSPTKISIGDEIIWTSDTGRTLAGLMVGGIIDTKETLSIEWSWLEKQAFDVVNGAIHGAKFFSVLVEALDIDMTAYRGAITKVPRNVGEDVYYETASVDFIQR